MKKIIACAVIGVWGTVALTFVWITIGWKGMAFLLGGVAALASLVWAFANTD